MEESSQMVNNAEYSRNKTNSDGQGPQFAAGRQTDRRVAVSECTPSPPAPPASRAPIG